MAASASVIDYRACLPAHLRAYCERVRASGPFIPPRAAVPSDYEAQSASEPLGDDARYSASRLIAFVVETSEIGKIALNSERRSYAIVKARHIAMWLCYRHTGLSYPKIGRRFGDRDHTTVISAVRRVNQAIERCGVKLDEDPRVMARRLWHVDWTKRAEAAPC